MMLTLAKMENVYKLDLIGSRFNMERVLIYSNNQSVTFSQKTLFRQNFCHCFIFEPHHEKTCLCHMRTTRRRSACASAQSDQRLCCSLPGWHNTSTCYLQNFKTLVSFCGCAGRFEFYLVKNPKNRSHGEAHFALNSPYFSSLQDHLLHISQHGKRCTFMCGQPSRLNMIVNKHIWDRAGKIFCEEQCNNEGLKKKERKQFILQ